MLEVLFIWIATHYLTEVSSKRLCEMSLKLTELIENASSILYK
jgi:hypothetical protein